MRCHCGFSCNCALTARPRCFAVPPEAEMNPLTTVTTTGLASAPAGGTLLPTGALAGLPAGWPCSTLPTFGSCRRPHPWQWMFVGKFALQQVLLRHTHHVEL